jgi:hypothetical protein
LSNFKLAYGNQADDATLTAGSWNATLARDNLKSYILGKKARSTDATAASTKVRFALAEPAHIGVLGLMATNASVDATYRFQLFSDAGFTASIYDSGTTDVYPLGTIPFGQIPFGAANWWTGRPLAAEVARFQRNVVHVLTNATYAQYGELQITDTTNPDGYFEAGRLFVGSVMQPAMHPEAGKISLRLTSRTESTRARDGTPYFNEFRPDVCLPFSWDWMDLDEGMRALDIQAIADTHGEVWAAWDTDDVRYLFRRQVFGRLKQLDTLERPAFAQFAMNFEVEGTTG